MIDVNEHLGLAYKQARKIFDNYKLNGKYEYEDIFQMCCFGLIRAAQKFDESRNLKFSTLACKWMWGYTMRVILRDKFYPAEKRDEHLSSFIISTDTIVSNCEKPITYNEVFSNTKDDVEHVIDSIVLKQALENLSEKERKVIELRYFKDKTQTQVGEVFGHSQVYVSRLEKKILNKLREYVS